MQILNNATIKQIFYRVVVKNFTTFHIDNVENIINNGEILGLSGKC
ncbi:hypothetical protein P10159_0169 [Citrobacter portucalensis]|nr:hypothetical protein P10159_0169 [Citrobacter portucalensis]